MGPYDERAVAMRIGEVLNCIWAMKPSQAPSPPGSAAIANWALALLTILFLINLLALVISVLFPWRLLR